MTYAFRIIGTVHAETLDDALRAVAAYTDPDNADHDEHGGEDEPIGAIAYQWHAITEDDGLGDTYDSRDVTRILDADRDPSAHG